MLSARLVVWAILPLAGLATGTGNATELVMGAHEMVDVRAGRLAGLSEARMQRLVADGKSILHAAHLHTRFRQSSKAKSSSTASIGARPALYYVEVTIGSPGQTFRVDLDTGSSTLAIPSISCSNCESHCDSPFDHEASSTWTAFSCTSQQCCGNGGCSANSCAPSPFTDICGFTTRYGDGSGISGVWGSDVVSIGSLGSVSLNFGAFTRLLNGQSFMPYEVSGILGIAMKSLNTNSQGSTSNTLIDALHNQLGLSRTFSMCFGSRGGILTLGKEDSSHVSGSYQYTDAVLSYGYWGASVVGMSLGSTELQVSNSMKQLTLVDSGTTLMLVDSQMFDTIVETLMQSCSGNCGTLTKLLSGYCVQMSDSSVSSFPTITVQFSGGGSIVLPPSTYLRQGLCVGYESLYVFGIADGGDYNILGITAMLPYTWVFDYSNRRIGWAQMSGCNVRPSSSGSCGGGGFSWEGFFGSGDDQGSLLSRFANASKEVHIGAAVLGAACACVLVGRAFGKRRGREHTVRVTRKKRNPHDPLLHQPDHYPSYS